MFENSKWIWINNENNRDEYADFVIDFELGVTNNVNLDISVDGNFEAYLNGELLGDVAMELLDGDKIKVGSINFLFVLPSKDV